MIKLFILFILFFISNVHAVTFELKNTNLSDAIRLLTKSLNMNVIISSQIKNETLLNLSTHNILDTLNLLLTAHDLVKLQKGNSWLIIPKSELIKQKQQKLKWQEINEAMMPLYSDIKQIKYAKADEIAKLIQQQHDFFLSNRGHVMADQRTNVLCVKDVSSRIKKINNLIRHLDIPLKQVVVAARLVSIDSDYERELGLQFFEHVDYESQNDKVPIIRKPEKGIFRIARVKLLDDYSLDVKLAALENRGHAELISSPCLFTSNQQSAAIESGEEVPYQETSDNGGTSIAFKKAVLGLKVTPQILPKNNILLQLHINQDRPNNKMIQGMPTISTRRIITSVLAKHGQTVVLGGIYESSAEAGILGLPIINHIPIVNWFFQHRNTRQTKRELLIFVTPKIINIEG